MVMTGMRGCMTVHRQGMHAYLHPVLSRPSVQTHMVMQGCKWFYGNAASSKAACTLKQAGLRNTMPALVRPQPVHQPAIFREGITLQSKAFELWDQQELCGAAVDLRYALWLGKMY